MREVSVPQAAPTEQAAPWLQDLCLVALFEDIELALSVAQVEHT